MSQRRRDGQAVGFCQVNRESASRSFRGLSKDTFLLALASFFADMSTEMLYPVLPIFLTQSLHASGSIVGLIEGIAQATQNLAQGLSGGLSDKLNKRKPIALIGYAMAALAKPLMGLSGAWQGVVAARFLDRLGTGVRSAPRDALVASSADPKSRGRAFGLEGLGDNAGAFVGPLIALFVLYGMHADLRHVFYFAVIPGSLAVLMIGLVKERPAAAAGAKSKLDVGIRRFPKAYWKYLLAVALFGLGNVGSSFLILQTQDRGASMFATLLIYAAFNGVAAGVSYPAGMLSDRWGRKNVLLASFVVLASAFAGFALATDTFALAALFGLYGVFQGAFRSVGKALASDFVPERLQASGVGWFNATLGLVGLAANLAAGLLWDHVGHAAVFVYGAAASAIGFAALLVWVPGPRGHRS
jgi:MFS family permease